MHRSIRYFALFERTTSNNWRASVASETLTGVTQSKIGDVCLFIYLFIYMDVRMSFCTLTLAFLCQLCGRPRPKLH